MKTKLTAVIATSLMALSGQASAKISGCVATADLPLSILGMHDTIRVTHQQAGTNFTGENNAAIRVVDKNGNLLGIEYTFSLDVNASKTFAIRRYL